MISACTLEVPLGLTEACQTIADGRLKRIDVGFVNGRPFINVASIGISVEVAQRLTQSDKRRWGLLAYAAAAWEALHGHQSFALRIRRTDGANETDGDITLDRCIQIAIGNGRYYGGGMTIADDAAIDDGRLALYAVPRVPRWRLLVLMPLLRWGRHHRVPDIVSLRGRSFIIETQPDRPVNVDGELVGRTPASFEVVPHALAVFVPKVGSHEDRDDARRPRSRPGLAV